MHAFALALLFAAPPEKPPATLDEKIAAALKSHPDIKAAEAKKVLAEAELEQARLSITVKVSAAASRIELAKAHLVQAEEDVAIADKILKLGNTVSEIEKSRYQAVRPALIAAKANLAAAELELQLHIGPAVKGEVKPLDKTNDAKADTPAKMPSGPVIEKMEGVLAKPIKLDLKSADLPTGLSAAVKTAGLDGVAIRGTKFIGAERLREPPQVGPLVGEWSFAAWVEMMIDAFNGDQSRMPDEQRGKYDVYVRDYGLLVELAANAPKDAMTLTEFARAVRAKQR